MLGGHMEKVNGLEWVYVYVDTAEGQIRMLLRLLLALIVVECL